MCRAGGSSTGSRDRGQGQGQRQRSERESTTVVFLHSPYRFACQSHAYQISISLYQSPVYVVHTQIRVLTRISDQLITINHKCAQLGNRQMSPSPSALLTITITLTLTLTLIAEFRTYCEHARVHHETLSKQDEDEDDEWLSSAQLTRPLASHRIGSRALHVSRLSAHSSTCERTIVHYDYTILLQHLAALVPRTPVRLPQLARFHVHNTAEDL